MPHQHHRHAHAQAKRAEQNAWDKLTSEVAAALVETSTTEARKSTSYRTVYVTMTPSGWTGTKLTTIHPTTTSTHAAAVKTTSTTPKANTETLEEAKSTTTPKAAAIIQSTTSATEAISAAAESTSSDLSEITSVSSEITSVSSTSIPSTLAVAPTSTPTTFVRQASTSSISTASATSSASAATNSGEVSGGAKAGIAIGVLAGVLVVFLAVFFLFTKRRKQMEKQKQEEAEDEKRNGPFSDVHAIPGTPLPTTTTAKAPRLSFRPGSQFLPNLMGASSEKRASRGANAALSLSPAMNTSRNLTAGPAQQPAMSNPANNSANPFGNNAERMQTPIPEETSRPVSPASAVHSDVGTAITTNSPPLGSPIALMASNNSATMVGVGAAAAGVASAGVAVGLARKTSIQRGNAPKALDITRRTSGRGENPVVQQGQQPVNPGEGMTRKASLRKAPAAAAQPLDLTMMPPLGPVPPSPSGTDFSVHSMAPGQNPGPSDSAAAIAAAGGPPQSTVHRVQLDFKPTMEDEMELRAGQLVRLLHEYDDGWALCIRLDRSQQGVVPRTCLSTRPVKPRPAPGGGRQGPPVNPNRGPGPMNRPPQGGPPGGPQGGPYGGPNGGPPYPRPGSAQNRRNSPPGGQQYPRPGSAQSGRQSPAGGYPMGRPRAGSAAVPSPMGAGPRPMSPAMNANGPRPQSPGPRHQQPRPQSPSGMSRRMSPPGQSPMNQQYVPESPAGPPAGPVERKPVPGQAS